MKTFSALLLVSLFLTAGDLCASEPPVIDMSRLIFLQMQNDMAYGADEYFGTSRDVIYADYAKAAAVEVAREAEKVQQAEPVKPDVVRPREKKEPVKPEVKDTGVQGQPSSSTGGSPPPPPPPPPPPEPPPPPPEPPPDCPT